MATPARVTGSVLSVETRNITRTSDGQKFTFISANVLVAGVGVTVVSYRTDDPQPAQGEVVDLQVDIAIYNNKPQVNFVAPWDARHDDGLAALIAA